MTVPINGWLIALLAVVAQITTTTAQPQQHPIAPENETHDMICNNGTEFQCVCLRESDIVYEKIPNCEDFLEVRELPVVDMRLRHVNLESDLYTNEKYETYFKRRIANIVSAYCEHQANECPGTALRINKDDLMDENGVLYAQDEDDPLISQPSSSEEEEEEDYPLFTQENVILLKVEREARNVTRIRFAIAKNEAVGVLNELAVIDPVKVKYILGSQAGPLARILGGIHIDSVRVGRVERAFDEPLAKENDNSRLLIMIYVVATFFIICYIIGSIRIYRDCQRRKKEKRAKDEEDAIMSAVPNYGTCAVEKDGDIKGEQRIVTNGGLKEIESERGYHGGYQTIDENVNDVGIRRIDSRHARLMFACDPSQLPKEASFDDGMQMSLRDSPPRLREKSITPAKTPISREASASPSITVHHEPEVPAEVEYSVEPESVEPESPPAIIRTLDTVHETIPSEEVAHIDHQELTPPPSFAESSPSPPLTHSPEQSPLPMITTEDHDEKNLPLTVPSLILHPSNSMCDSALDSSGPQSAESNENDGYLLTLGSPTDPIRRPCSRRGSRADEIDIDEILDMRERHASPDHHHPIPPADPDLINRSRTAQELDQWSSSDGEVDVYYKMSEDEAEGDDWDSLLQKKRNKRAVDSESEEEIEERVVADVEDGYVYERLREEASPLPPHVISTRVDIEADDEDDLR